MPATALALWGGPCGRATPTPVPCRGSEPPCCHPRNALAFTYLEEFPVQMLAQLETLTGRAARRGLFVVTMEYGRNFSGPEKDVFFYDRSVGHTEDAWLSNFLHPVIYFYRRLPTGEPCLGLLSVEQPQFSPPSTLQPTATPRDSAQRPDSGRRSKKNAISRFWHIQ